MVHAGREMRRTGSPALAAAVSAALTVAGTAAAQTSGGLEEIIVTATRRAESLQDVSESISAFDTKGIEVRGLNNVDDLAKFVPGLSFATREPGGTTIVFRGVTPSGLQFGAVSSSGLYLDEQPITQSGRNPDPRLIDIERIEALRGPQGSLYGASSQSGTLRVITNKPDPTQFDAYVEGEVSSIDQGGTGYDLNGMVNIPLVQDRLALRLVGFTSEDAGYIDNILSVSPAVQAGLVGTNPTPFDNATQVDDDVNSKKTSGGRAALRWDVTDDLDLTLGALFQDVSSDGHGNVNRGIGDFNQIRFSDEGLDDEWYQLALTMNASLPFGDLVVSASYFDRDFRYEADASDYEFRFNWQSVCYDAGGNIVLADDTCASDTFARSTYYTGYDFGGDPHGFATNHEQTDITTFEARLQSRADSDSRWSWLIGAFYSAEKGDTEFVSYIRDYQNSPAFAYFSYYEAALTGNPLAPTEKWFIGLYDTELDQVAVFGELGFDVTDQFTITAGGRWFDYDRKFAQIQEAPQGFHGFTHLDGNQKTSEDGTVGKLNLTYHIDPDRLVYATWSEGFRVGGSNPLKANSLLPRDYDSDKLTNYEIGAKTEWFDNRFRLNIAAYYMEWDKFAVQVEDPQLNVFQLGFVNLPSAEIPGVEGDFALTLSDEWQVDGSFSWNDAQVSEATTLSVTDEGGETFSFQVKDGARLPLTPDWTATIGVEYRSAARWLDAQPYARFDYSYVGDSVNSLEGIESVVSGTAPQTQEAYQTGDLRFGLESERWSASIFVNNVWNEYATLFIDNRWGSLPPNGFGNWRGGQRLSVLQPLTYGLSVRFDF
jgi:outer membrane receptor protein involved in Fe transport